MSHKGNDYLVDNLMDREVKKPEKKTKKDWKVCPFAKQLCTADVVAHNEICDEWEEYHEWYVKKDSQETWKKAHEQYKFDDVMNKELFIAKSDLPSEGEIEKIINGVYNKLGVHGVDDSEIAKAISKRIRG